MKYFLNIIIKFFLFLSIVIILFASLAFIYKERSLILSNIPYFNQKAIDIKAHHLGIEEYDVNPLKESSRQLPPTNYGELKLFGNEDIVGAWTSPFDWNVIAIHSVLLPDGKVMTMGSYAIEEKSDNQNPKENKTITLTDGFELERDKGDTQWYHHDALAGVDFDIWDPTKGILEDSHTLIKRPLVVDAFCSVIRVLDLDTVFLLGGNKEPKLFSPDTQNATTIYNIKNQKFIRGEDLKYKRWYGSIVRTADDKFVMIGGTDVGDTRSEQSNFTPSIIPEIFEKDENTNSYTWRELTGAKSKNLFGDVMMDEWSYPKSFLASDGNIFGISYNKLWKLDPSGNGNVNQVGEIPLVTGGIKTTIKHNNPNDNSKSSELKAMTIGAGVGSTANALMIDKDKILLIGGKQVGEEYIPSNHVNLIDISNTSNPKIQRMTSMNYPRSNANSTILPNGEIFVNGGHSLNDYQYSILTAEIYNPKKNTWKELSQGTFRRNYHSTSLLLPNGTILVAGGDVWNAEIYYPPYLFTKNWKGEVIFAERPEIEIIDNNIINRSNLKITLNDTTFISKISIISTGSVTHAQASEPKYLNLDFKKINDKDIVVNIPENKNILQKGTYMIFALNASGVPSVGKIVYLN